MKKLIVLIMVLLLVFAFVGCSSSDKQEPKTADDNVSEEEQAGTENSAQEEVADAEPLIIGTMPGHQGVPIQYAIDNGMYEEAGLNIELVLFPTGAPINEALAAEQIDIAGSGMASIFALASGDNYWLGDNVKTVRGLGIYVRPDNPILEHKGEVEGYPDVYGSADTIKGITVLGPLGTAAQFNAIAWAQLFGVNGSEFEMLHMDPAPATQAFIAGEGDAIACFGPPFVYDIEAAGFIEVGNLTTVSGMEIADGIVARKKVVDARRDDVKKFLEVTYAAVDIIYDDDDLLKEFAQKFYNDNGREYTDDMMWGEINDKDYIGKKELMMDSYRFGSTMIGMGKFYLEDGKLDEDGLENVLTSMYPEFLEEIYGIELELFGQD